DQCGQGCVRTSWISRVVRDEPESLCRRTRTFAECIEKCPVAEVGELFDHAIRMMNATVSKYCTSDDSTVMDFWNSVSEFYDSWRKHIEAASCGRICSDYRTNSMTVCCREFGDCYYGSVLDEMKPRYPRDAIEFVIAVDQFTQGSFYRYAYGVTLVD
ncbi:hypothetical protein AAVH_30868, partial [Aphelenchoides avenae]